ncbi:protein of unknown function [Magnetospirillum gryphiswaldense MSR-1 v2]|uniref:Uncharacterized protein n=1 Tax=Magnetospirillum gryphiswaldense (strain DSM 6361 / JCM 21280 / NBRC 15271 / MSR-1) TaxID=431944 RepID=V6F3B5_MAGGM|nr:protein of unknown function [Magnetospirillum gryphiswaldense MSR-1 v2]
MQYQYVAWRESGLNTALSHKLEHFHFLPVVVRLALACLS